MRHDKIPTVMFPKKYEDPVMQYHCKYHPGCRSVRLHDGSLRCQICGSPEVAIRTIILNNPSSLSAQELRQKGVNN